MTQPKTRSARPAKATSAAPRQKRAVRRATSALETERSDPQPAPIPSAVVVPAKGPSGKLGLVVALMRRAEGATIAQMGETTGWQPHSVRGALAGSLKRKHRLTIVSKSGDAGRVYRIDAELPA